MVAVSETIYVVELTTEEISQIIQLVEAARGYVKRDLLNKLYYAEAK